jgi:hypothetical protein
MPILRGLELVLELDDVLRAQGGDPAVLRSRRPLFLEIAERALAEGVPLLRPAISYRQLAVERLSHEQIVLAGGGVLSGPLVVEHLAPASQVIVVVCTISRELEDHADRVMASDLQFGLALDGVGSAAAEALAIAACHHLEKQADHEGLKTTTPISPGMVGWPVGEGQQEIFSLLDSAKIGVALLPSGMMVPRKSLSMAIGLGPDVVNDRVPCDYCNMRERCRYRSR